ncbi:MAG: chloride channel protein [Polyangiaceae bacterium]|jgi:CIC family chloride channel protein|nr:chloride channel protein [Polyangiaceae bacterium]
MGPRDASNVEAAVVAPPRSADARRGQAPFEIARYLAALVGVAALAAAFAVAFRASMEFAVQNAYRAPDVLSAFTALPTALRLTLPAAGAAIAGLLAAVAARRPSAASVGDVMEAVALGRGRPSLGATLWKAAGSFVALASGGSIGREGPLIQFGGAIGGHLGTLARLGPGRTRALIAAGTAAGFAAAYNTPLAAVLFVLEIVAGVATLEVVLPVVAATALATAVTRAAVGGGPIYGVRTFSLGSEVELFAHVALGAAAGTVGAAFLALLAAGERFFARVPAPRPLRAALGGFAVGAIAVWLPAVVGNGYEAINLLLEGRFTLVAMLVMLAAKALATTASVASGSPGGVFTPSLLLGAALGGAAGTALASVAPPGSVGATGGYALVGMAALAAATTHAPAMAAVLVFELSGDYQIVLPLLLATATATFVSRRLRPESVYTEELRRRGVAWQGSPALRFAGSVRAADIVERHVDVARPDAPLAELGPALAAGRPVYVPLAGGWGAVTAPQPPEAEMAAQAALPVTTIPLDLPLQALAERVRAAAAGEVLVIDPASPTGLAGVVTWRAVLGAYDAELFRRDTFVTRVVWFEGQRDQADHLELPPGFRVEVVRAPRWAVGKTLGSLGLDDLHVTVVAAQRAAGAPWAPITTSLVVQEGDRWNVVADGAGLAVLLARQRHHET